MTSTSSVPVPVPVPMTTQQHQTFPTMWYLMFSIGNKVGRLYSMGVNAEQARLVMKDAWAKQTIADHKFSTSLPSPTLPSPSEIKMATALPSSSTQSFSILTQLDPSVSPTCEMRLFRTMEEVLRYGRIDPVGAIAAFMMCPNSNFI